jgi:hypothetical protein
MRKHPEKKPKTPPTPGAMLDQGMMELDTPDFMLSLVRSSQTVAALKPKGAGGFDFTPGDLLVERSQNGYFHLGDIDFRLRNGASGEWQNYSSSTSRFPVTALPSSKDVSCGCKTCRQSALNPRWRSLGGCSYGL